MNAKLFVSSALALSFAALTGCSAPAEGADLASSEAVVAEAGDALSALTVSASTKLSAQLGAKALPKSRLPLAAFDPAKIGPLVNASLTTMQRTSAAELAVGPGAHLTLDRTRGGFLLTTSATNEAFPQGTEGALGDKGTVVDSTSAHPDFDWRKPSTAADPRYTGGPVAGVGVAPSLQGDLALLGRWGLPAGEIARSFNAQTMAANHENGVAQTPAPHRFKTFAIRGFGGIEVRGHRAVVSHAGDGRITRVLANWPALAGTAHKLSTRLSAADVVTRGKTALAAAGVKYGVAQVYLEYVPTTSANGECTLKLTGVAKVRGADASAEHGDEARTVDFDVSAY
jgi:hypothetical protein